MLSDGSPQPASYLDSEELPSSEARDGALRSQAEEAASSSSSSSSSSSAEHSWGLANWRSPDIGPEPQPPPQPPPSSSSSSSSIPRDYRRMMPLGFDPRWLQRGRTSVAARAEDSAAAPSPSVSASSSSSSSSLFAAKSESNFPQCASVGHKRRAEGEAPRQLARRHFAPAYSPLFPPQADAAAVGTDPLPSISSYLSPSSGPRVSWRSQPALRQRDSRAQQLVDLSAHTAITALRAEESKQQGAASAAAASPPAPQPLLLPSPHPLPSASLASRILSSSAYASPPPLLRPPASAPDSAPAASSVSSSSSSPLLARRPQPQPPPSEESPPAALLSPQSADLERMKDHLRERMQRDWLFYCQALQMEKSIKPQQNGQAAPAAAAAAAAVLSASSSSSSFSPSSSSSSIPPSTAVLSAACKTEAGQSNADAEAAGGDSVMTDVSSSEGGVDVTAATYARTLELWTRTLPLSVEQHAIMQQIISHVQTAAEERQSRLKREQEEERARLAAESASVAPHCSVCLDSPCDALLQPCGHVSCCAECATDLKKRKLQCPRCNVRVRSLHRIKL